MNNTYLNNSLITAITASLSNKGVLYNAKQRRLRYNNYIINLIV